MFWRKREKFAPDLVDLVQYEKNLLYARENSKGSISVRPISDVFPGWSESEMQAMRDNRAKAEEIKKRIFGD